MILECAECHTRYLVPDSAIGPEGRLVRCANCKHSWHQPPPPAQPPADGSAAVATTGSPAAPAVAEAIPDPDWTPPARARRNPARLWTTLALTGGVGLFAAVGVVLYASTPGLLNRMGLDLAPHQTPLMFAANSSIDRHDLPSGNEYFQVKGAVVNPTGEHQHVPDIRVVLKDARNRTVYSWSFQPASRDLGPKASLPFDSAMIDVPATSKDLVLTFSDEG